LVQDYSKIEKYGVYILTKSSSLREGRKAIKREKKLTENMIIQCNIFSIGKKPTFNNESGY
jgi:hypothetical protein